MTERRSVVEQAKQNHAQLRTDAQLLDAMISAGAYGQARDMAHDLYVRLTQAVGNN